MIHNLLLKIINNLLVHLHTANEIENIDKQRLDGVIVIETNKL